MLDCHVRPILHTLLLVCCCLLTSHIPAQAQSEQQELLNNYVEAREYSLQLLNELRVENGLNQLRLEPLATELALAHAQDMAENEYFSHWNLQGRKPTRRYNELGGMNGLGENIFYSEYQRGNWQEFIEQAMLTLKESPAHLNTMLDPSYTDVGIGMAVSGERFYLAQEFLCRIGGEYECRLNGTVGSVQQFSGRIDPQRYEFNYIVLRHEPLPEPREREWLSRTSTYREGDTMFAVYTPHLNRTFDVDTYYDVRIDDDGRFDANLLLDYKGKPGTYYILLMLHDKRLGTEVKAAGIAVEVLR